MRNRPGTALLASVAIGLPTLAAAEAPVPPPRAAPATDPASATQPWPPNFSRSVQGTGVPGLDGGHVFLWNRPQGFDPVSTLRVDRHVPEGSGEATHTYKALWALGSTGPHNAGYEWTITGELHNRALASTGAQNVAVNGTIFKEPNGLGPVGPSWAGNFNCVDMTDEADPVASCIGAEIDVSAQSPTTDRNRQRVGLQISTGGVPGAHTGYGILMGNLTGSITDRAISFQGEGTYGIGIDAAAARFTGVPMLLAAGQAIGLDGNREGGFSRSLGFDGRDLVYGTGAGPVVRVTDSGRIEAASLREPAAAAREQPRALYPRRPCLGRGLRVPLRRARPLEACDAQRLVSPRPSSAVENAHDRAGVGVDDHDLVAGRDEVAEAAQARIRGVREGREPHVGRHDAARPQRDRSDDRSGPDWPADDVVAHHDVVVGAELVGCDDHRLREGGAGEQRGKPEGCGEAGAGRHGGLP